MIGKIKEEYTRYQKFIKYYHDKNYNTYNK